MDELYAIELRLASFETGIFCKGWGQLEIGECRSGEYAKTDPRAWKVADERPQIILEFLRV